MGTITKSHQSFLAEKFGTRVNFDPTERKLYGHDIGGLPSLVQPLVGKTIPEGIVQPKTKEELCEVVSWAYQNDIAITPRAKASSGYGGVLPTRGGLVVDFFRLNNVLNLDKETLTAKVEAGIVWEKLERKLENNELALKLYPSSAPGSTVGGWFCQGGAGFGSYESGWFSQNVVAAEVVMPDGTIKEMTGPDLDLVADAEGVTGLIYSLTIKIMPKEELGILAVGCPDAYDLQKMIQRIVDEKLPIWSMTFINPKMAELKTRAPLPEHLGHPTEERVILPASYITTIAFRKKDELTIREALIDILKPCEGKVLDQKIAEHEWENRFKLMVVKRLGPSLVPTEVVVPLSSLGKVMMEIERKINKPLVKEGAVIREGRDGKPEVVILGFIPADQRKFSYNLVFPLSLSVIRIAMNNGGRPYSTGLYFKHKAKEVLGADRFGRMTTFKNQVDSKGLLNPGKVLGKSAINYSMQFAQWLEPLIRPFGNQVTTQVGERPTEPVKGIPADVAWYAYSCSQCGYCVEECDQFYGRGWESQSPRGKWFWLREYMEGREKWSQKMVDSVIACTTCELCNKRCSAALPIEPSWMKLRHKLIYEDKKMTFPPFYMMGESIKDNGNIWAGYRKNRGDWFPEDLKEQHYEQKKKDVYFAGCTASYVEDDIGIASARILHDAGVDYTFLGKKESCCGTPMLVAGLLDEFALVVKTNIKAVQAAGGDTVITSCPACDMMWRHVYPAWAEKLGLEYNITSKHYSEVLAEKINSGEFKFPDKSNGKKQKVTWHDSCHMGRVSSIYEPPRDLIKAVPGVEFVEMTHHHEEAHCCGSVLSLIKDPEVAHDLGEFRLNEAVEVGAEKVMAACPCCQFQLRVAVDKREVPIEVVDLAHFAAEALGYDLPNPLPAVRENWKTFEAMIPLMTPQGFADLMKTMWPEVIDAMPFGMGHMMRLFGKMKMVGMMKPMFPILFPKLLPMMLPKLMNVMLDRIGRQVPMADYMREQMPTMMPPIMDALLPHMVGDLVPLVSDPMIEYLHGDQSTS